MAPAECSGTIFCSSLSDRFTVYAPVFPGTDPVDTMSIHQVDDIFDVVLAYEGALRALGLQGAPVIGPSFGGMLAAELAAEFPRSVQSGDPARSRRPVVGVGAVDPRLLRAPHRKAFPGCCSRTPTRPGPQEMFASAESGDRHWTWR